MPTLFEVESTLLEQPRPVEATLVQRLQLLTNGVDIDMDMDTPLSADDE
jgi:hypothetical protein